MLALEYFRILFGFWFCFCLLDHLVGSTLNTHEITSHPSLLHADSLLHGYNAFGVLWQHRHMEGSFYNGAKQSYHEKKLHTSRRIDAEPLSHMCIEDGKDIGTQTTFKCNCAFAEHTQLSLVRLSIFYPFSNLPLNIFLFEVSHGLAICTCQEMSLLLLKFRMIWRSE